MPNYGKEFGFFQELKGGHNCWKMGSKGESGSKWDWQSDGGDRHSRIIRK